MFRILAVLFFCVAFVTSGFAGQNNPPGSNNQIVINSNNLWAALTVGSGLNISGGSLVNTGVLTYPSSGLAVSTGSAWSTSVTPGTGVLAALGINVGTAGSFLVNGGALGTPSSGTLTNTTGLPTTGLTGFLQAAQEPAHTGDMTNTAGSLTTVVGSIGGKAVSLGGAFTLSGAFGFTGTVTGTTAITFPTSGTLLTTTGSGASLTGITYSQLPTLSANQLLGALTATTPSGQSVPSCSAAGNALNWTSGTGFGCATGYLTSNQAITLTGGVTGSGTTSIATTVTELNGNTLTNGDWCSTNGTIINCTVTPITNTNQLTNGSGYLTANQTITLTGDTTGSGTTAITTATNKIGGVSASLGGAFTMSGAFTFTGTVTGNTSVTYPTSGTLLTTTGSGANLTGITYSQLPALAANQVLGSLTATAPSGLSIPSCSGASNALIWTSGTGFGCNSITAGGGSVTTTGTPASGNLTQFSGASSITNGNISGDCTTSGTLALTCTKINSVGVSLAGTFTTSGAFPVTLTASASTNVTLPTSGTLLTTTGSGASLTGLAYSQLPTLAANQLLGALTATTPSGQSVPSCSAAGNALNWTSGTGFVCATGYLTSSGAVTTFSAGSTGLTPNSATSGAITLAGTLAATNGGTGQNSSTSTGVPYVTSGTWAFSNTLPSAVTATTQTGNNNTTALATTAYVDSENGLVSSTTISTTGGSTTLTATQYSIPNIIVTGALTSAVTLVFPNNGQWRIQNNTTGNYLVTAKTAAGTGTLISQGYSRDVVTNGTNLIVGDSDYFSVGAYTNTASGALDPFYGCLRKSLSTICRIVSFGDSIITCTQVAPCTYGPYMALNSPIIALRNELLKSFVQYSTGLRVPFRLMPTATIDGGEGGYTLTSGTITNTPSVTYGPGQTGYSLNGQALLQCTATCVLTINVGQGYRALNIYCVESASNTGWTVTVGGTSLGTACGTTSGTTTGVIQTFSTTSLTTATASSWSISGTVLTVTTVASGTFATGGVLSGTSVTGGTTILYQMTGATAGGAGTYALSASSTASSGTLTQTGGLVNSTFTLTSTGTSSFLGGYEAITTMGNVGFVLDNMGEGAISAAFWTQNSTALGWFNQLAGQVGLCIHEGGQNDSQNPSVVTPAQVVSQFQTVATACNNRGAAFSFFIPTPYNSTTANQYAWIQQAVWLYGQNPVQSGAPAGTLPWDILTLSDAWPSEGFTGPNNIGGAPNFIVQDSAASIAQAVASGLLQAQDSQHPTDYGSCLITSFMFKHLFARNTFNCNYNQLTATPNNKVKLSSAQTNATTTFQTLCEGTAGTCAAGSHPFQFPVVAFQTLNIRCHGQLQVSAAATVLFQIASTAGTPASLTQTLDTHPTATTVSDVTSLAQTAYSTAVTSASITTTATNLSFDYTATVTHVATPNATALLSVQAHPSTGTLTLQPDTYCIAE